jgi:hypothetical protein
MTNAETDLHDVTDAGAQQLREVLTIALTAAQVFAESRARRAVDDAHTAGQDLDRAWSGAVAARAVDRAGWSLPASGAWLRTDVDSAAVAWASADASRRAEPAAERAAQRWEAVMRDAGLDVERVRERARWASLRLLVAADTPESARDGAPRRLYADGADPARHAGQGFPAGAEPGQRSQRHSGRGGGVSRGRGLDRSRGRSRGR